ncbi:MAG: alpha/beta hydrolase fold containing protein [Frankiales bacterium]|nr:alpha/beta hydrolase fold containing protein [Frankiales bacterium]
MRRRTVFIGGERVQSVEVGEHRPGVRDVVCVHGLGVSSGYFVPLMRALAPHTQVLAPDLPGFGRSSNPRRVYDIPQLAAALDQWLELQAFDAPPVLVANSMGCQIVGSLVDGRQGRAASVVLIGPTFDAFHRTALSQISRLIGAMPFERLGLVGVVAYQYLRCGPRRLFGSLGHGLADPLEAHMPQIAVPTLVVRGERDPIAPQDWCRQLAALAPCGEFVMIPETGHAVNYSAPDKLLPYIFPLLRLSAASPRRSRDEGRERETAGSEEPAGASKRLASGRGGT